MDWDELTMAEKASLIKTYVKNGIYTLDEMRKHYSSLHTPSSGPYSDGGPIKPPYEQWYKTVPEDRNDTTEYNLRRAYDLASMKQLEEWRKARAEELEAGKKHLNSVYRNPQTGEYEFMKSKNHPTIQYELDWYNSNDPEAVKFRQNYSLDTAGNYYKYIPNKFDEGGWLENLWNKAKSFIAPEYKGPFDYAYSRAKANNEEYFKWNGKRYKVEDSGETKKPSPNNDYSKYSFGEAFNKAFKDNSSDEFGWNGKVYTKNTKEIPYIEEQPVYKVWENLTGLPWSYAKEHGFTDGSEKANLGLRRALLDSYTQGFNVRKDTTKYRFDSPVKNLNLLRQLKDASEAGVVNNYSFNVPSDEKEIVLKDANSGKNLGTKIFPTVLDSLAVHGIKNNISPYITFGLPAQESAMSPNRYGQTNNPDDFNSTSAAANMLSAWDFDKTPLSSTYAEIEKQISNGNRDYSDLSGTVYGMKKYADFKQPENIIDWSYNKFKQGTYNLGDPNHTKMVTDRGKDFVKSKEIQNWFYNHFLPGQDNKEEIKKWWNTAGN